MKPKCEYCNRGKKDKVILILKSFFGFEEWNWICLECLLSKNIQEFNDKKEVNKIINFYTRI